VAELSGAAWIPFLRNRFQVDEQVAWSQPAVAASATLGVGMAVF
jgi:Tfp pilus assembly protein PilZ